MRSYVGMTRVVGLAGCCLVAGGLGRLSVAQDCSGTALIVSAAVVTGLAVFDIASTPASVRRYNERHATVAPMVNLRDRSYGVSVSWSLGRSRVASPAPVVARPGRQTTDENGRKSATTGVLLGLSSTALPMGAGALMNSGTGAAVFLGGVVVGPSVGHFYAGQVGRGLATLALRAAGTAVGISSLVACIDD